MCPNIYSPKNIHTQKNISVLVAQLDRVSASEAEGRGFDSRQAHHFILSKRWTMPAFFV